MMKIINADDFGLSLEINDAIEKCFSQGLINQTTLLVNMPYTKNAVERSIRNGYSDKVGLHLNLVEGKPLTESIKHTKLCDKSGCFNENLIRNKINRFYLDHRTREAVKNEVEAQINCYLDYGFTLKHVDSHEHVHTNLSIILLLEPLLSEYGIKSVRLTRNLPLHDAHGMKAVYKSLFNSYIKKYNRFSERYSGIRYFGSLCDSESSSKEIQQQQELMVHPTIYLNSIIDTIYKCDIEKWEHKNIKYKQF